MSSSKTVNEQPAADNTAPVNKELTKPSRCKSLEECDERTQDELIHSPTAKNVKPYNNDPTLPLYTINNVPEYIADNKYIWTGYRAYYSTYKCVRSITRIHNETFNIWTHLIGGIIFAVLITYLFYSILIPEYVHGNVLRVMYVAIDPVSQTSSIANEYIVINRSTEKMNYINKSVLDTNNEPYISSNTDIQYRKVLKVRVEDERTIWPFILFGVYSIGCVGCMLCSASYHTLSAHISERWYHIAHKLDYFGITLLIVGSFIPFCFYTLECEPLWRNIYTGMILIFGFVGMLGPLFRSWTSASFATKKNLFYVCMGGSGLLPITHIFFLPNKIGLPYVRGLLVMLFLYGTGVFFYVFKIPEIFRPGQFDIYFSSHQIFHVFVLAAALTHFFNCIDMYVHYD